MTIFFSTLENLDKSFPLFSLPHIIPLFMIMISTYIIIINRKKFENYKIKRIFMITIAILMLISQGLITYWYSISSIGFLKDGLPLYLCRITSLCIIYSFLTNTRHLNFIIFFIGSLGSTLALIIPDTSGYLFPHIMYMQFFIIHGCMFLTIIFLLFIEHYRPDKIELKKIIYFIFSYSLIVSIVNRIVKGNYGYLETPPVSASFFEILPAGIIYKLGFTTFICLVMFFIYFIFKKPSYNLKSKFIFSSNN